MRTLSRDQVDEVVFAIGRQVAQLNLDSCRIWMHDTAALLWRLLGGYLPIEEDGAILAGRNSLAEAAQLSPKKVRARLELLAEFGLVMVVHDFAGSARMPSRIYANPALVRLVMRKGRKPLSKAAVQPFLDMAQGRDEQLERPQGFWGFDVEYGEMEPVAGTPAAAGRELAPWARSARASADWLNEQAEKVGAERDERREAYKAREQRKRDSEEFVQGCATVWQMAQEKFGRGSARPVWEGPFETLSPENRKAYSELRSLFERYGGERMALAWTMFCHYRPFMDAKGKPVFDPNLPHAQWVSADKKPAHFAKHLNALLSDPEVVKRMSDPERVSFVHKIFGRVFSQAPRHVSPATSAEALEG